VRVPGQGVEFDVQMKDGTVVTVQLPPRPRAQGERPGGRSWLPRGPHGLPLAAGHGGLAVAVAATRSCGA
jgi:two-component system OmpR family sensor kinase